MNPSGTQLCASTNCKSDLQAPLNWLRAALAVLAFWVALGEAPGQAQTADLRLRFGFDEAAGTTTTSDSTTGGARATLALLDYAGAPVDCHGAAGSGVGGRFDGNRALDFSSSVGQGTNGPVAALTNAALGFGEVQAFTATVWFKAQSRQRANIGPRLFVLGAEASAEDTGATNTIGLKFQTGSCLHFQVNRVTAEAEFVWSLPLDTWQFVAMVYDGSNLLVYHGSETQPAELVRAKAAPGLRVGLGDRGALFIGNRRDRARAFDGLIDDFRFYTGAAGRELVENIRQSASGKPTVAVPKAAERPGNGHPSGPAPWQWVVVTAPMFTEALAPLVEHRRAEGFNVTVLGTRELMTPEQVRAGDGRPIRDRLGDLFRTNSGPNYALLVGAGPKPGEAVPEESVVPALSGSTARMKDQPTDFGYSLPDAHGRPTVAVGRFPARSADELRGMITKTLRLERGRAGAEWRNRMLLVQGNPGGGFLAETYVDGLARPRLERLHPAWRLQVISHNGPSLYYLPTEWLQARTLEWLAAGDLFAIYLGHSFAGAWSTVGTNFMSGQDWGRVNLSEGQGVFFSCGCFGCQWDRAGVQAYGLAAMRNPAGPTAVIGALGESYSAPGLLAVDGLLRRCVEPPFPTRLAHYWLAVQEGLAEGEIDPGTFGLLDLSDGTSGKESLAVQRQEHLEMWTLLGDPALRLPVLPLTVSLTAAASASTPGRLNIEGRLPAALDGATVHVTLERPVGARPENLQPLPARSPGSAAERDRGAAENQRKANDCVISTTTVAAHSTNFACALDVPPGLRTPLVVVRAVAQAGEESAQGVLRLPLAPAPETR